MEYTDFYKLAVYGNKAWKGSFTEEEIKKNAEDYLCEFNASNKKGEATSVMQELCKLLIEDITGGSEDAEDFLDDILWDSDWTVNVYHCNGCKKREIAFFSVEELKKLQLHAERKMLITDAIPNKPQWIRETFCSGKCLCPECWQKYWRGELL